MNNEFVTLSDEQLEAVSGGTGSYNYNWGSFNGDSNTAVSTAESNQAAASINTGVVAIDSNVGNISQSASNTSITALISKSFNHSFNTKK